MAAVQVVCLHYASAFLPAIGMPDASLAHFQWERWIVGTPLFNLWNGYASVYLFFLLSGVALTYSFGRAPFSLLRWGAIRIFRLGLPMIAAIAFGALLIGIWPQPHIDAAPLTGSTIWMSSLMNGVVTWREVLHQMAIEGMIFGFQDTTALPHLLTRHMGLGGLAQSFDTPLWTLHLEFLGSFLVLFLVLLRAVAQTWVWRSICIALIIAFPASPLCLFVIGHLVAPSLHETTGNRSLRWLYVACLVTGLVLCSGQLFSATIWVTDHLPQWQSGQRTTSFSIQNMIGALLIFLGLSQMPSLRGLFCGPLLQWLGRISFSLYLTHFPLLFTVISMLFLCLLPLVGYAASITLCSAVGLATSLFVAVGFERLVDRPAIRLSRLLGASGTKFLGSPNDAVTSRATVDK